MQPQVLDRVFLPGGSGSGGKEIFVSLYQGDKPLVEMPSMGLVGQVACPVFSPGTEKLLNPWFVSGFSLAGEAHKLGTLGIAFLAPIGEDKPGHWVIGPDGGKVY
jgi:hypothetical protein